MFQKDGKFRTRSGRTVTVKEDGGLIFDHANGYLSTETAMDAEEFFQAKRDAEIGRWRWPENPHYVVYPLAGQARVIDERTGREHVFGRVDDSREWAMADAAEAYFEAHPERKPWHGAEADEVWVIDGKPWGVYGGMFRRNGTPALMLTDAGITDARRIWPEDAS